MYKYRNENLKPFFKFQTKKRQKCICCGKKKINLWTSLLNSKFTAVKCSNCNFIWMNPFTLKKGLSIYY